MGTVPVVTGEKVSLRTIPNENHVIADIIGMIMVITLIRDKKETA